MFGHESLEVFAAVEDISSVVRKQIEGWTQLRVARTDDLQVAVNEGGMIRRPLLLTVTGTSASHFL